MCLHLLFVQEGEPCRGECFYFDYGAVAFWGLSERQEREVLRTLLAPCLVDDLEMSEVEVDEFQVGGGGRWKDTGVGACVGGQWGVVGVAGLSSLFWVGEGQAGGRLRLGRKGRGGAHQQEHTSCCARLWREAVCGSCGCGWQSGVLGLLLCPGECCVLMCVLMPPPPHLCACSSTTA
jgi:hypothetical protein